MIRGRVQPGTHTQEDSPRPPLSLPRAPGEPGESLSAGADPARLPLMHLVGRNRAEPLKKGLDFGLARLGRHFLSFPDASATTACRGPIRGREGGVRGRRSRSRANRGVGRLVLSWTNERPAEQAQRRHSPASTVVAGTRAAPSQSAARAVRRPPARPRRPARAPGSEGGAPPRKRGLPGWGSGPPLGRSGG